MAQEPSQGNGVIPKPGSVRAAKMAFTQQATTNTTKEPNKTVVRPKRPNYNRLHASPLPVMAYPLPVFIPHNPLSYLSIAYTLIKHYWHQPTSHDRIFEGYFDALTNSVHVTEPKTVRALWEMGFFGKGSLSRSEPTWLHQEKRRLGLIALETSEELTEKRRVEREKLKRERARVELEAIEEQLRKEAGVSTSETTAGSTGDVDLSKSSTTPDVTVQQVAASETPEKAFIRSRLDTGLSGTKALKWLFRYLDRSLRPQARQLDKHTSELAKSEAATIEIPDVEVTNQEHLQLTLEEAFFLVYALGCFKLTNICETTTPSLLQLFRANSYFPPVNPSSLSPDDPFLLQYTVYHHFRSRGWVVRDGIKFAVDYLLYERGPVFKHAAFAVIIIPSYSHAYWQQQGLEETRTQRRKAKRDWTWLHCVNRVQTHVIKTLVLVYVDVPPPDGVGGEDVGAILGKYKVREFCISRWSANRNRD